jgi:hypothetical protein
MNNDIYNYIGKKLVEFKIDHIRHLKLVFEPGYNHGVFAELLANKINETIEKFIDSRHIEATMDVGTVQVKTEDYPHSRIVKDRESEAEELSQWMQGQDLPWLEEI